jgi:hypothetical protein
MPTPSRQKDDKSRSTAPADVPVAPLDRGYVENENHIPDPLAMYGHVDTTGTGGDLAGRPEQASPVFAQARAAALANAVAAVDDHPQGRPDLVVFPDTGRDYETAVEHLRNAADDAVSDPQLTTGLTPAQVQAGEEGEPTNPNVSTVSDAAQVPARPVPAKDDKSS